MSELQARKSSESTSDRKFTEEELDKMAEYSANLYAKSDEEKKAYVEYYRKYYSEGGDAAPALAALQVSYLFLTISTFEHRGVYLFRKPNFQLSHILA